MGLDKADYALLERAVRAVEKLADSQHRIAVEMERASNAQDSFRGAVENLFPTTPITGPAHSENQSNANGVPEMATSSEAPRVIDSHSWFIDTKGEYVEKGDIAVRLTDGTIRKPTSEEAARLN